MERRIVTTTRPCEARLVPTGDLITIPAGAFITLTQSLGGTFTVVIEGNMARIAGADADAIGLPPEVLKFEAVNPDGTVNPNHVRQALESVFDPEIPVNIADLGLIYDTAINDGEVNIAMTLTAPGCGMGPVLVQEVKDRVATVPNVTHVSVELVFDPPWSREMMSEEAQLELGVF
ncbi:MAG: putative Fe-S cluster assembly protein SufT [Pseudomonadales bacterium]|nr:putative Fe-S cluster assembly protein SufT [Pseudomonadales bacterium]